MSFARIMGFVIAGVSTLLILVAVGAVVALSYIDFNRYKPLIADAMRTASGRELTISGDLRLELSLVPGIVVDGVTLSNAEWGSRPEMVTVRRLEAQIALASAIFGVVEFSRIELSGADILLEIDALGRANFDFSQPDDVPEGPGEPAEHGAAIDLLPLTSELRLRESRLLYTNAVTGARIATDVESLVLRDGGPVAPLALLYEGNINAVPIRVSARLGGPAGPPLTGGPWPAELRIDGPAVVAVKGSIADPFAGRGLDLAVSLNGDRTSALSKLAGVEVPELGAYSLSGRVTGDALSRVNVAGLKAQVGASDIVGDATVEFAGPAPAVAATLVSARLDLAALGSGMNETLRDTATALSLKGETLVVDRFRTNLYGANVMVSGTVADVFTVAGLDLAIAAQGDRFADLSERAGRALPALGGYSLAGRVTGDFASAIEISGLAAQVGGSDIAGMVKLALSGEYPAVEARLASDRIDLAAFDAGNAPLRGAVAVFSLKDDRLFIESLKAELSGAAVTVQGTIAEPARGGGLALSVVAKGERFSDLSGVAGREMPALGGYAISTRLTGDATTKTRFSDIVAQLGKSDLEGYATVALTGGRPFFNAVLSSNKIDLAPLGGSEGDGGAGPQAATQTPDRLFPDDPLPLEGLKAFDIGLRLDAATVTGRRVPWRNAALVLSLRNGLLDIESFRTELYDGVFSGAARIDARTEMAGLIARVTLRNVDLKPVLEEAAVAGALEGRINFDLDVAGRGNSVRQIMASLDGKITLAMGKGRIRSRTLQTWVGGPRRILSNVLTLNVGGYTAVNCGLGVFDIREGLATADGLLLDTDVAAFGGTGTVNLGTEALDLIIDPKVKKTTLSAAVPVYVRGTLASPEYSLDTTAVARRVGGFLGALAFPPALILGLGELGTFKDGDCAGRAASTEDQTLPEGADQTTEDQPPALPGRILKGTGETITKGLKGLFGQ